MVEGLVAILDADQHFDRLPLRWRIDLDRLEPALERALLLDGPPILSRRGRADAADFAARQRRLQDVRRIERAFGRTAPTSVCSSSMKTMMLGFSVSSFMIALRRSSN